MAATRHYVKAVLHSAERIRPNSRTVQPPAVLFVCQEIYQQIIMPEPHHEDPASSPKSTQEGIRQPKDQQRRNPLLRWTTVTLPPPIFFVPLLLAAIYFLFSSPSQVQQSCSLQPIPQVQPVSYTPSPTPKSVAMASSEQT
jgi:nucleoside-diphosphate kinase